MNNEVTIVGSTLDFPVYSHEFLGKNYYVCNIKTTYLRRNELNASIVRVYIPEEIATSVFLSPKSVIKVKGSIINSTHDGHKDISVVADSVEITDEPFTNQAKLTGVITRVFTNDSNFVNFVNFLISLPNKNSQKRAVSLRVVAWAKLADYIYNNLKLGDKITVIGALSSSVFDPSKEESCLSTSEKVIINELYCTACAKAK